MERTAPSEYISQAVPFLISIVRIHAPVRFGRHTYKAIIGPLQQETQIE